MKDIKSARGQIMARCFKVPELPQNHWEKNLFLCPFFISTESPWGLSSIAPDFMTLQLCEAAPKLRFPRSELFCHPPGAKSPRHNSAQFAAILPLNYLLSLVPSSCVTFSVLVSLLMMIIQTSIAAFFWDNAI